MLFQIIMHTPIWVWAIFLALLWLGLTQAAPRRVTLRRVVALPLVMTALSLYGTLSVFGPLYWSWVLWTGAMVATSAWFATGDLPPGVDFDATQRQFNLPGSWAPLGLMMAIFLTRYIVGVVLALNPALTHDVSAGAIVASIYGALSGVFVGRMVRLLRFGHGGEQPSADNRAAAWG